MSRRFWMSLVPSVVLAVGMLVSSFVAKLTADSGWWVMSGPLLMVLAIIGASVLGTRLNQRESGNLRTALILGVVLLVASGILMRSGADRLAETMPILCVAVAFPFILPTGRRRGACDD